MIAMRRGRAVTLACAMLLGLTFPACLSAEPAPAYISLTGDFTRFYDETAQLPEAERVSMFRQRFDALFPGFYEPRYDNADRYDGQVANALKRFPEMRDKFEAVSARFPKIFAAGIAHFQASFPGFTPDIPIYLVHSLGEMDGGTRTIRKHDVMIFGADVIARIHGDATIGPFFDHELFHIYHARYFKDCPPIRCGFWQEGLATYAAGEMNRTSDPAMLMLSSPAPIIPEIEAHRAEALCFMRDQLNSTKSDMYAAIFFGGERAAGDRFPKRFGYYLGYLVAQEAAKTVPLQDLARLNYRRAKPLIDRSLAALIDRAGGCLAKAAP